jgi:hypothetical protein
MVIQGVNDSIKGEIDGIKGKLNYKIPFIPRNES